MQIIDITCGMSVIYVPPHAQGNMGHPECEEGVVESLRGDLIFVRFSGGASAACHAKDLRSGGPYYSGNTLEDLHDLQASDFQALLGTELLGRQEREGHEEVSRCAGQRAEGDT